jgi:hypothetical protein
MKATHRLIDSVWTVDFSIISPTEIIVNRFSRDDQEGYDRERELPQCTVKEDEHRRFVGLFVRDKYEPFDWCSALNCDHEYTVVNPKHVFDYK